MKKLCILLTVLLLVVGSVKAGENSDILRAKEKELLWRTPQEQELNQSITLATDYMLSNCNKYGQFAYRRDIDPEKKYPYKYNLLRHCGAIYALGMVWDRNEDPLVAQAIDRACDFLFANGFISPWPPAKNAVAIWDIPGKLKAKVRPGEPIEAKLGGAGLGILAFMARQRCSGKGLETAQKLGAFVLSMQRLDGSFICKVQAGNIKDTGMVSLYYPGEAMLGLMRLYEADGDKKWLESVARGISYLAKTRKKTGQYPPDHWILIASADFIRHMDELKDSPITRSEVLEQAQEICRLMTRQQLLDDTVPLEFGSFRIGGFTCPTATRVEGLCAAMLFIEDKKLKNQVRASLTLGVNFLMRSQVKQGPVRGGFPRSVLELPIVVKGSESTNRRMNEIRIDYVQHAISGLDMFQKLTY